MYVAQKKPSDEAESIVFNKKLNLPWKLREWNVHVTMPISTVEIWARLNDIKHSASFDAMTYSMAKARKFPPTKIDVGGIYIVNVADRWHRVRVDDKSTDHQEFDCFFIDSGCLITMTANRLFFCSSECLALPPQAIHFSIAGLEEYSDHPYAGDALEAYFDTANSNNFVVRSFSEHTTLQEENIITAEFYEIVDGIAISCADTLPTAIAAATPTPSFAPNKAICTRVSHVSDNGIVYFQLDQKSLRYVHESIQLLGQCEDLLDNYDFTSVDTVLVRDVDENRLFRAQITDVLNKSQSLFTCLYIDYGYIRSVPSSNIFSLKMSSNALYTYPKQAIPARLSRLPEFDEHTLRRLQSILASQTRILVRPIDCKGPVATVDIFKRERPSGHIVCINEWIRMENELQQCNDIDSSSDDWCI